MISNQIYRQIRGRSKNDFDFLYNYFLESGGKSINPKQFTVQFQRWCLVNGWDNQKSIEGISKRLDERHR